MTKEEVFNSKNKSIGILPSDNEEFKYHRKKHDFVYGDLSPILMGQYFLYESLIIHAYDDNKLYYPKLAIYINALPCG